MARAYERKGPQALIPRTKTKEPPAFDAKCRKAGGLWLARGDNAKAKRPKNLWAPFLPALEAGFGNLCGYGAMWAPTNGTVDHFVSWNTSKKKGKPELAYEWKNYRFASGLMNNIKRTKDERVLDPFEVGANWFEISLPDLQMSITDQVPKTKRQQAEATLDLLGLRDDERVIRWRQGWYAMYQEDKLTLEGLRQVAPLIAAAVDKRIAGGAPR